MIVVVVGDKLVKIQNSVTVNLLFLIFVTVLALSV